MLQGYLNIKGLNKFPPKVILWGGTGQAKVVRPIIEHYDAKVVAVFDDTPNLPSPFDDVKIYRGYEQFQKWIVRQDISEIGFCVAVGNPHGRFRVQMHEKLEQVGLKPITLAHPSAIIADNVEIGAGTQIMAGAIIGPEARIGRQCIINTKASMDHECILGDGVELAPGVTLCGLVRIGVNASIYAGATVLPRITIGNDAVVGAGALITKDVPDFAKVAGVPARPFKKK
jgi:sugar O-acyltransferase (sialic acid O-acetyltransferase NeuD family)